MFFDFEYFCGANVVVSVDDVNLLEAAAISFGVQESRRPIYGYSSRHFDAVASGQVLVQGSLVVNMVHRDYLFSAIRVGKGETIQGPGDITDQISPELLRDQQFVRQFTQQLGNNPTETQSTRDAYKRAFWDKEILSSRSGLQVSTNPHDRMDSVDIKITFGRQAPGNNWSGVTNYLLSDVFFTGRSVPIQISEDVIVEQFPFFARDVYSFDTSAAKQMAITLDGDDTEVTMEDPPPKTFQKFSATDYRMVPKTNY